MLAPPSIQLTQWNHDGWTYFVSCMKNAPTSFLAQEHHHLLPVQAPPRRLNLLKSYRKPAARLRSRSRPGGWRNAEHHDPDYSVAENAGYHWSAAAPDTCVASHARRPTPPQSNIWSGFNNRAYGPCPNKEICHNNHAKLRSNMLWCTACWASMSPEQQAQCHREANTTE